MSEFGTELIYGLGRLGQNAAGVVTGPGEVRVDGGPEGSKLR